MECEKESTLALREEVAALREDEMKHQRSIRSAENYEVGVENLLPMLLLKFRIYREVIATLSRICKLQRTTWTSMNRTRRSS